MTGENTPSCIKSEAFAIEIIGLYKELCRQGEYVMSKQILRSGTSIGANVAEAQFPQSRADFMSKMGIALKEARETVYWLKLLHSTRYISDKTYDQLTQDCTELVRILAAITKNKDIPPKEISTLLDKTGKEKSDMEAEEEELGEELG